ncbi:MAG: hypothetical protein ABL998_11510, partial [Planctomycetota bacterium]
VPALDRLLEELAPREGERAAAALARLPAGRERLIARVTRAFADRDAPSDGVLATLLGGFGRALAEVPRGGEALLERRALLLGRVHAAEAVRTAAQLALASFTARCTELGEAERAERVLVVLAAEGWPALECLRRRLDLAWFARGDPAAALTLARELEALARVLPGDGPGGDEERAGWGLRARLFAGAALVALGREPAAAQEFTRLADELGAGLARRADLYPSPRQAEWTRGGGAAHIDRLHMLALVEEWRALLALAEPARAGEALAALARAHELFLRSREVAVRTDANDPATLDALFKHPLGPHALVLFNERLEPARRGTLLARAVDLAHAWAGVAPLEMLGFVPSEAGRAFDPLLDPRRFAALEALRAAHLSDLARRQRELADPSLAPPDPDEALQLRRILDYRRNEFLQAEREEAEELAAAGQQGAVTLAQRRTIYSRLLDLLSVSTHIEDLALELRSEGRAAEARALVDEALAALRNAPLGSFAILDEWNLASLEILRGDTFMDENRPKEAEQAFLAAVGRLEKIEQEIESRRAGADDPEAERQIEGQLALVRARRAGALLSLAVNANVRAGDPVRALGYFERAYVLDQSPSMEVLRACYRARSGRADEARTVLRKVVPSAQLYYNIACTHALMGEKGPALDFLERDFRENYPTPGARVRQTEWARKDPDLSNLRGEPRFERLLGGGL